MSKEFEILPHTADLKIRAYGSNLQMLFCNVLKGMFESIHPLGSGCVWENDRLRCEKLPIERMIDVASHDLPSLLVDFLSEALYLSDVYGEAYLDVVIDDISHTHVCGVLRGVMVDDFEAGEIKAVTHHDLVIEERDGEWVAEVLFDL